jgi:cytochrome c oxidase cbb3-type subunit 1
MGVDPDQRYGGSMGLQAHEEGHGGSMSHPAHEEGHGGSMGLQAHEEGSVHRGFSRGPFVAPGFTETYYSLSDPSNVLPHAALHSLAWLYAANLIGVWLAVLLLFPNAGHWLGPWSYGRWTPVHLNFQLYGWMALPLVAWAMRIYGADRGPLAPWSRAALTLWSLALTFGAISWLQGNSSGKLFLDWSGFSRIFFPLAILFLWCVLALAYARAWHQPGNRSRAVRTVRLTGLALLLLVPLVLYLASSPGLYPAVNPDTGGPTGASQLESTLIIVLILLLLPYGLTRRKPARGSKPAGQTGVRWIISAWLVLAAESFLCLALGRADVSHHRPVQFLSLGSLLVWVPLIPAYFSAFEWPRNTRLWRIATMAWWAVLVPTGWAFFLPGILDRLKFTDGLVAHSILAMAGFVSSLLIFILAVLLGDHAEIFNSRWAFIAWHGGTLGYVILFLAAGWHEGADPAFTIVPGPARNVLYGVRLLLGIAMTAASAEWLRQLTVRLRGPYRGFRPSAIPEGLAVPGTPAPAPLYRDGGPQPAPVAQQKWQTTQAEVYLQQEGPRP